MAAVALEFLLENLKQVLLHHAHLIRDAKDEVVQLDKDLRLCKALLTDLAKHPKEIVKELLRQIQSTVYDIEDVIDNSITEAARGKQSTADRINVAKKVKKLREDVNNIWQKMRVIGIDRMEINPTPETEREAAIQVPKVREDNIVGFDEEAENIISYLKNKREELDVISIIGLPGLGKTTLAGKIFRDRRIQYEFPTRIWVYVSQEFRRRNVFLAILSKFIHNTEYLKRKTDQEIAKILRDYLAKCTFLIVMDDVWTAEAWRDLKDAFPKMHKTSKILITSRNEEVALEANRNRDPYKLRFLTHNESLQLLYLEVFGESDCPKELKDFGEVIAQRCGGLPLAIVVIGGILVKKSRSRDIIIRKNTWREVSESVPTYLKDDSDVDSIIALSYDKLPFYLRSCFLYLGMFPEDFEIPVWTLIRLWIAEGFIPQKDLKTLEQTALEYLEELVNRNLVMVEQMSIDGKIRICRIHDMLRQFCKNKSGGEKEDFFQEIKKSAEGGFEPSTQNLGGYRRLCIHSGIVDFISLRQLSGPRVRSFLCSSKEEPFQLPLESGSSIPKAFKLLRILDARPIIFYKFPGNLTHLVLLRYIVLSSNFKVIPEAIEGLWNLQTLVVYTSSREIGIKANIWKMLQLRHVKTNASAKLPKRGNNTNDLGQKLQTLSSISLEGCTEDMFDRLRSLRKLGIRGRLRSLVDTKGLDKLDKLEKLKLVDDSCDSASSRLLRLPEPYGFPPKLRSLTLCGTNLEWPVHMSTLGVLDLEVLKLKENAFTGETWEVSTGHFGKLEVLHMERLDLVSWVTEAKHFPELKCLVVRNCEKLEEIPYSLSDVKSFQRLDLKRVSKSAAKSATKIQVEKKRQREQEPDTSGRVQFKLCKAPGDE